MLKKANITLDLKNATPEERSNQAKAMAAANKEFKANLDSTIGNKESFILDGTGASFNQTSKLKDQLEEAGYEVFMLYVYTDLERSLKQNQDRYEKSGGKDRSLAPGIVMKTWKDVTQNYEPYKNLFGSNFVSVANTLEDQKISDLEDIMKTYLDPFKPKGTKPKTPKQQASSDARKAKDAEEIKTMLNDKFIKNVVNNSVSREEAQSKLKSFLA
jgi:predicted kinase